jgi:N-acetylglucosaminyldiphosphoundecaprenol N-acetyl-beta-D-mannosaminyltransferase
MAAALCAVDRFVASGKPHYYVAINAAKVVEYHYDPEMRAAVDGAHLRTADGQAVVWAAKLLGTQLPERVAGADLMLELLRHSALRGYRVYFLGATQAVVERCVERANELFPSLTIAGFRNGHFRAADEQDVVAAIRDAKPDIVFLGFGTPAKEYFMHRWHGELGVPFVMGVGGTFDVFAGLVKRAPRWMQEAGLEWSYRLAQEPRRMWKRYLVGNTRFMALVTRELIARGRKRV